MLTLSYDELALVRDVKGQQVAAALVGKYKELSRESDCDPHCILLIKATGAGSAVVLGLYQLYKECAKHKGQLLIVGYPKGNILSLLTLGLTGLKGFILSESVESAARRIAEDGNDK